MMTRIGWKTTLGLIFGGFGLTVLAYVASAVFTIIGER